MIDGKAHLHIIMIQIFYTFHPFGAFVGVFTVLFNAYSATVDVPSHKKKVCIKVCIFFNLQCQLGLAWFGSILYSYWILLLLSVTAYGSRLASSPVYIQLIKQVDANKATCQESSVYSI